jgi:hypothetical protein
MKMSLNSFVSTSSAHRKHSSANFLFSGAVAKVGPHEDIAHETILWFRTELNVPGPSTRLSGECLLTLTFSRVRTRLFAAVA